MYPGGPGGTIPVALNRKENHERLAALMHPAIDDAAANAVPEHHLLLRQPQRDGRCRRGGQLRRVPQRDQGACRGQAGHHLHGVPEQQGEPQGLHVRPHCVGSRRDEARELTSRSRSSTTSTTPRSWTATSSATSATTSSGSATSTRAAIPGRHEIDETQELNYRFVMQAIAELGLHRLRLARILAIARGTIRSPRWQKAIEICDV